MSVTGERPHDAEKRALPQATALQARTPARDQGREVRTRLRDVVEERRPGAAPWPPPRRDDRHWRPCAALAREVPEPAFGLEHVLAQHDVLGGQGPGRRYSTGTCRAVEPLSRSVLLTVQDEPAGLTVAVAIAQVAASRMSTRPRRALRRSARSCRSCAAARPRAARMDAGASMPGAAWQSERPRVANTEPSP